MAHTSKGKDSSPMSEFFYDNLILENQSANKAVRDVINDLITRCATIIHKKELMSQRIPFSVQSLTNEMLMNVTWAYPPLDNIDFIESPENQFCNNFDPDDDLEIPPIDEWASGVLPVRNAEATGLRTAVDPTPKAPSGVPKTGSHIGRRRPTTNSNRTSNVNLTSMVTSQSIQSNEPNAITEIEQSQASIQQPNSSPTVRAKIASQTQAVKKRVKPPPTTADTILRTFEDVRKKANISTKNVTVDSDFTVIQITEPHGLPPSLIVPRIQTKKLNNDSNNDDGRTNNRSARFKGGNTKNSTSSARGTKASQMIRTTATIKKPEAPKKRPPPKIIETDQPKFDTEISDFNFTDRISLNPGVTFKEGNLVKSRPPQNNTNQLTRSQYEEYYQEMVRSYEQE